MSITEIFKAFEANTTDDGIPRHCGVPLILETRKAIARLYCLKCGREATEQSGQWIMSDWGSNGIALPPNVPAESSATLPP